MVEKFDKPAIHAFNIDGTDFYWHQLALNRLGHIDTWFVFWYAQIFLWKGLSCTPRALVQNIGHDGSGIYCADTGCFDVSLSSSPIALKSEPIRELEAAYEAHKQLFGRISREASQLMMRKVQNRKS